MAIRLEDKKAIVADVNETAGGALSVVMADYRGVTSTDMTALRAKARSDNVRLKVVRNNLARRAVEGTEYECIQDALVGPTLLAFSMEDPGAAARLLKDFAKENKAFEIKGLAVGGELMGGDQIDRLAKLPTLEEALTRLAVVTQAPITKLARTFNEVPSKITRAVAAVRDQKKDAA
ncbi:LSU ribosomal protein L10P [Tamilnaduibacter salinus]|uniref:Large ribosomal subunit protein uL10 n=1 Tax=Tamilnaduibacter salinus TaxID=1484056 RepID=A0A2A2I3U3_9GAMM|nr:50S ribosomal protein L10 [Tamilnaduibacter salinus]PAV26078.1 50S ribosomal protein L10 [Tamilnaduibacter salinus]PVY70267.1 LSU ribosomal protein L10P [Tamilnaduibacter salinus]